jgi:hypothetical protein
VKQIAGFVLLNSNPYNIIRFMKSSSSMMNNLLISVKKIQVVEKNCHKIIRGVS